MKKTAILFLHSGYWFLYFLLLLFIFLMNAQTSGGAHGINFPHLFFASPFTCLFLLPAILGFYLFYAILFPKFLLKKKIVSLVLSGVLTALMVSLLTDGSLILLFGKKIMLNDGISSLITITLIITVLTGIHGTIALVIRGFITGYSDITIKEELSRKNYETELALVKSQINPHFLFNTINNIDVLIQKDPPKASEYLNKLSDIMRFMLYETKAEKILLSKELEYIEKYIALQKIRTLNLNYINYSVQGLSHYIKIEPMLFIPFIENAFKHSENYKNTNTVSIHFEIKEKELIFECSNACDVLKNVHEQVGGLGNALIEKRLNLLYPDKHHLHVKNENGFYFLRLSILTNDN